MAIGDAAFSSGDIMRRLRQLETEVRELRSARRLESSTIGEGGLKVKGEGGILVQNGGDLEVTDGGEFRVMHPSGSALVAVFQHASGKYQISIRRDDSTAAFQIRTHSNGEQFWALWDRESRILVSDDAESGKGLARPWLPVMLYPRFPAPDGISYRHIDASLITSEDTLWEGRASISHPKITVDGVWGQGSGSNTSSYRLEINGTTVGSWNETGLVVERQEFDVSSLVGSDNAAVKLFASASGTGVVACQVYGCHLQQS